MLYTEYCRNKPVSDDLVQTHAETFFKVIVNLYLSHFASQVNLTKPRMAHLVVAGSMLCSIV